MKRINLIYTLIASTMFLTNCKKNEIPQDKLPNNNPEKQASAGDGKWDLLGHGYDATGDYADYRSAKLLVIDINKIKNSQDSSYLDDAKGTIQTSQFFAGKDATTYMSSISQRYSTTVGGKLPFFKGNLTANFNSKDSTILNADYVYSSLNLEIIQRILTVYLTPQQIASKYLTSNFINDINTKTPKDIVTVYGTHILTKIVLGGSALLSYKARTESSDRETAARAGVSINGGLKVLGVNLATFNTQVNYDQYSKLVKSNYNQELNIKCKGGDGSKGVYTTLELDKNSPQLSIAAWQSSLSLANATLIDIGEGGLIPIYDFVSDPDKKAALKTYIEQYFNSKNVSLLYKTSDVHQFYNLSKNVWRNEFNRYNPEVNTNEWTYKGVVFKAYQTQAPGTIPIYEFFAPSTNDRTWGTSPIDDFNYWTLVGPKYFAYNSSAADRVGIYRYYHHKSRRSHFLGQSPGIPAPVKEWTNEGIKFYTPKN